MSSSMSSSMEEAASPPAPVARRQRRPALACEQCRKRKTKCDQKSPCGSCEKAGIHPCTYSPSYQKRVALAAQPSFRGEDTEFSVFDANSTAAASSNGVLTTAAAEGTPSNSSNGHVTMSCSLDSGTDTSRQLVVSPLLATSFPTLYPMTGAFQQHDVDSAFLGLTDINGEDNHATFETFRIEEHQHHQHQHQHQPGGTNDNSRSSFRLLVQSGGSTSFRGSFLGSKFLGQSHWLNFASPNLPTILSAIDAHDSETTAHTITFAECESARKAIERRELEIAQSISSTTDSTASILDHVRRLLPRRAVADRLVQAYLRTYQSVFGILYVPTFRKSYDVFWEDSANTDVPFCLTLILALGVGYAFIREEPAVTRSMVLCWLEVASTWLTSLRSTSKVDLDVLRVYVLLLLSCQVLSIEISSQSLSSASLLNMAMEMGLHVDLKAHHISQDDLECRRRLWAAILELHVQACMDSGRVPSIGPDDYDCAMPSNMDDATLEMLRSFSASTHGEPMPIEDFTQCSIQVLLTRSLGVRLKIAKFINSFRENDMPFEEALSLDAELASHMKTSYSLIRTYNMSSMQPTKFQIEFFGLVMQKSLLTLHFPFAIKAISNPSHYYSRHTCLNASLAILDNRDSHGRQDRSTLALHGAGLFYDIHSTCALYLCSELAHYYQNAHEVEIAAAMVTPSRCLEMHYAVEQYLCTAKACIGAGRAVFEDYLIVACLSARVEAIRDHIPISMKVAAAVKTILEICNSSFNEALGTSVYSRFHQTLAP